MMVWNWLDRTPRRELALISLACVASLPSGLWPIPAGCGGHGALPDVHRAALRAHRAGHAPRPGQRPQRQGLVADAGGPGGPDGGLWRHCGGTPKLVAVVS